jgi:hypothetical protein
MDSVFRAIVVRAIIDRVEQQNPYYTKLLCEADGVVADKILLHNEILDHIEGENNEYKSDTEK